MTEYITPDSRLRSYLVIPRSVLRMDLNATELQVYLLLLDRARLSAKNPGWQDESGRVYLIYPIREMALALGRSESTVKAALTKLEKRDLLVRERKGRCQPNRIFVKLPEEAREGRKPVSPEGRKPVLPEGRKSACPDSRDPGHVTAEDPAPKKNYREKNTEQPSREQEEASPKVACGYFENVMLTPGQMTELAFLPDMERHVDHLSILLAACYRCPDPFETLKRMARGLPDEECLVTSPFSPPQPGPSPERPPSYP